MLLSRRYDVTSSDTRRQEKQITISIEGRGRRGKTTETGFKCKDMKKRHREIAS